MFIGLGVQAPTYDPATSANDQGVVLLLNAPGALIARAKIAGSPATTWRPGTIVAIIGYSQAQPGGLRATALAGKAQVRAATAGDFITATTYRYPVSAAGPNSVQPGDSGGPSFFTFPGGVGERVVGVHSQRQAPGGVVTSVDTRVNAFTGFINGGGIFGLSTFTNYTAAGNSNFNVAASWARGNPAVAAAPMANDVVIINPVGGAAPQSSRSTPTRRISKGC